MGLGKTVIAIALIIQNPPPLSRRVLPREHLWSLEKKTSVDHPSYISLPNVGQNCRLSNGTLIVVPMTLLRYVVISTTILFDRCLNLA